MLTPMGVGHLGGDELYPVFLDLFNFAKLLLVQIILSQLQCHTPSYLWGCVKTD